MDNLRGIIEQLFEQNQYINALMMLERLYSQIQEDWIEDYLCHGYFNISDFNETEKYAQKLIDRNDVRGYIRMCMVYLKTNRNCLELCKSGLKIDPKNELLRGIHKAAFKTPVLLLSGFLGSGKTTLVNHLIKKFKAFVLVNDYSTLGIDGKLIENSDLVELNGGCICCNLMDNFIQQMIKIPEGFELIIVEPTGISNPVEVASEINELFNIHGCWTVMGCDTIQEYLIDGKKGNITEAPEEDIADISELIASQLEFANVIILNKRDLVQNVEPILEVSKALNNDAEFFITEYSKIKEFNLKNVKSVVSVEKMIKNVGWVKKVSEATETEKYNINSMIYHSELPFDSDKIIHIFKSGLLKKYGVCRAKGFFWIPNQSRHILELSLAGKSYNFRKCGIWFAGMTPEEKEQVPVRNIKSRKYGDREINIVLIGIGINEKGIKDALDACLYQGNVELVEGRECGFKDVINC
jgi:G3E family GTPase